MRKKIINGILTFAIVMLAAPIVQAHGTTYLSNMGQASTGSVGSQAIMR
jgi:hypothetical protein